jgi:hypothetical protein
MPPNISFSAWNIHGLASKVLGDKTKNKDFVDSAIKNDFLFLNETWSNTEINVPGFKAFVSDTAVPITNKACRISGGITLLVKTKFEKYVTIVKKSKNFYGVTFQKTY